VSNVGLHLKIAPPALADYGLIVLLISSFFALLLLRSRLSEKVTLITGIYDATDIG